MAKHPRIRRAAVLLAVVMLLFGLPTAAWAHPLGNFTINQYAGLQVSREQIGVEYILDMAEIPAFQEIAGFDANGDGKPQAAEAEGYHAGKCAALLPELALRVDGRPVSLGLASSAVEFPEGAGGLPTLRLTCEFQSAALTLAEKAYVEFQNNAFAARLGWKEIVVKAEGVSLGGEYATRSASNRLRAYPQDLLTSPLEQRQVALEVTAAGGATAAAAPSQGVPAGSPLAGRNDPFTRLILLEDLNLSTLLIALAISFVWGAMHAMTPGHGKTIVGAYLVGSRGTPRHAMYLGVVTTITHTLGVFALGLITLFAAHYVVPEKLFPWISLLSGLFVVGIGANLVIRRLRNSGLANPLARIGEQIGELQTPAPVRAAVPAHIYIEGQLQQHSHGLAPAHGHDHTHTHPHEHEHSHGPGGHTHMPPGADGGPVTLRSLLLLGISGGILPCPSALVVLLGAIALNRIGFGLVLVLAFSLGLAGALTAIGLAFIYAGRLFEKVPARGKIVQALPMLSAAFIAMIGVMISLRALEQIGG